MLNFADTITKKNYLHHLSIKEQNTCMAGMAQLAFSDSSTDQEVSFPAASL
jgi:hypothetical protein